MSTLARFAAVGLVVALGLAAFLLLTADGDGEPAAVPTASASATESSATPQPTPIASVDAAEVFAEIEAQVLDLRGLEAPDIGPAEIIDREQLAVELKE